MIETHGRKNGKCEVCDNETIVTCHYGNMFFCDDCWTKELASKAELSKPENQVKRLEVMEDNRLNAALNTARQIDESITVRTDLFTAATVSITELKQTIMDDITIINKPYALAEELMHRFNHFKTVIFEMNQQIIDAGNKQKAIQVYLNQLANQLKQDEREKLKISDISYKPLAPKSIGAKTIKTTTTSKKIDKIELRKYAAELGVSEFTLQMLVVQKGITVAVAANLLRSSIKDAKSQ
jgi:hypothetical protein